MEGDIKVLVVDDSGLMRLILSDILNSEPGITVVDTAENGRIAVRKATLLNPDVILLDMNMGRYDGLYAVENILKRQKIPIIILSALGNSNLDPILEALKLGAVDYLNKPEKNKAKVREISAVIVQKVRAAAESNKKLLSANYSKIKVNNNEHTFNKKSNYDIIVIGASTGGPTAIERVVTKFPSNLPIPVIITQHMPANFVPSFAKRLNALTPLEVKIGRRDDVLVPGRIIVAPGSRNMIVKRNELDRVVVDFTSTQYKEFNNPSINALMLSVANVYGKRVIGAILTGMGKDGADGLEAIYKADGYTIGQDKKTSVVYGMPREVAERNVIKNSVPIRDMAGFIVSCLS
jgi:two-component system chemotaxis response regulator CheB